MTSAIDNDDKNGELLLLVSSYIRKLLKLLKYQTVHDKKRGSRLRDCVMRY